MNVNKFSRVVRRTVALALVGALTLCFAIIPAYADGDTITIASFAPLTGDFAQYGEAYRSAIELMVEQVNAEGGIGGKTLAYEIFDDKNDPRESATLAQRVSDDERYLLMIGPFASTCALAAGPIFQRAGIVEVAPTCTHPDFTGIGDYMFRGAITSELEGPIFADVTINRLGKSKAGIIYTQDDWGLTTKDCYEKNLTALGGEVVISESYISGQTRDFTPLLTKLANSGIDVLFICAMYNDTAMMLEQLRQLGLDGQFALQGTGSLYNEELLKLAGDSADGLYITASFFADNPAENVQAFVSAYTEKYGHAPNLFAASVYDGAGLAVQAMKNLVAEGKEITRASLRDALAGIGEYNGVTGIAHFNENRDVIKDEVVLKVEGGQFVYVP